MYMIFFSQSKRGKQEGIRLVKIWFRAVTHLFNFFSCDLFFLLLQCLLTTPVKHMIVILWTMSRIWTELASQQSSCVCVCVCG